MMGKLADPSTVCLPRYFITVKHHEPGAGVWFHHMQPQVHLRCFLQCYLIRQVSVLKTHLQVIYEYSKLLTTAHKF